MVKIYSPNIVGNHILIDVKNVCSDKIKTVENIRLFMDIVVKELNLNVIGECSYQFEKDNAPYGATMIYLLSESHLSVHTFVDEGKVTLDLFTCGLGVDDAALKKVIKDFFAVNALCLDAYYFTRGN